MRDAELAEAWAKQLKAEREASEHWRQWNRAAELAEKLAKQRNRAREKLAACARALEDFAKLRRR